MAKIELSGHFTYRKIFKITIAPILMVVFISLYSVIDGICIANFANHDAFAGVNLIFPLTAVIGGIGMLFGSGGSALLGKFLGEKKHTLAKTTFTNIVITAFIAGIAFSLIGCFIVEPFANAMGSITDGTTQGMVREAIKYGRILMAGQVLFILQNLFQSLFVVDGKPHLGFAFALCAGCTNIVFDIFFIGPMGMGATGAAIATVMGYGVGGIGPIIYFLINKKGTLYFLKGHYHIKDILKTCGNGLSEYVDYAATTVVGIAFNVQLLKYIGQPGVETYGIIMYVILIFWAIFLGYATAVTPIISYNFGAKNHSELSNLLRKSLVITAVISVCMIILGEGLATPIATIFAKGDATIIGLATTAMQIWSISFVFCGFTIFGAKFFVGLNDGKIGSFISIMRSIVLIVIFVFTLPLAMGQNGIWFAIVCSESIACLLSLFLIFYNRKKYHYSLKREKRKKR